MSKFIDADRLLAKLAKYDIADHTKQFMDAIEVAKGLVQEAPYFENNCEPPRQGDIVFNSSNYTYGIVMTVSETRSQAQIIECREGSRVFVNTPPLAALSKTGKRIPLYKLIMEEVAK